MTPIAENLRLVRERIAAAARAAGRDPAAVRLVAVSKTKDAAAIRAAYAAGQRDFGESYAQELTAKAEALADLPDLRWHFIGHLQTNKARAVAKVASWVHSVHNLALARELDRRVAAAGRPPLPVLLEVNIGGEAQKHGAAPSEAGALAEGVAASPNLALRGLMTVPPAGDGAEAARVFRALRALRDELGGASRLPELSMGMSGDLEEAIAEGATWVRIGTAIFGERLPR